MSNNKLTYKSFAIKFKTFSKGVRIHARFKNILSTAEIPGVYDKLLCSLPTVLSTECFNDKNLPFYEEVKETELGHLLEHVLLEYMALCKEKFVKEFEISGRTFWSNNVSESGKFTIEIYSSIYDFPLFVKSLIPACNLVDSILVDRGDLPFASVMPN